MRYFDLFTVGRVGRLAGGRLVGRVRCVWKLVVDATTRPTWGELVGELALGRSDLDIFHTPNDI